MLQGNVTHGNYLRQMYHLVWK